MITHDFIMFFTIGVLIANGLITCYMGYLLVERIKRLEKEQEVQDK